MYESSGSTITQNCSYIRNPSYPAGYDGTSALSFTVQKCDSSKNYDNISKAIKLYLFLCVHISWFITFSVFSAVCYLRLDFESFDISGLADSAERDDMTDPMVTRECQDKFTITVSVSIVFALCLVT